MKYIFVDIDGTVLDDNKKLSLENIEAFKLLKDNNYKIVLCSGRDNNYLIELSKKVKYVDYIISSNGSLIYDYINNKVLYMKRIDNNILKDINNYCINNNVVITFNSIKERYCSSNYIEEKKYDVNQRIRINDINDLKDKIITQIVIGSYNYDKMIEIREYIEEYKYLSIVNLSTTIKKKLFNDPSGFFYDCVMNNTTKGSAIKEFIKLTNIDIKDTLSIGDHINDIEMFNETYYKIAMGNSCDELKEKADFITKTNNENGFRYAVEYIIKDIK